MGYIGAEPATSFETVRKDRFTSQTGTTVTLSHTVSSVNDILVMVNSVKQDYTNYSVNGTTLTLGGSLVSADIVEVTYIGRTFQTVSPDTNTITNAMMSDDAIDSAEIVDGAVDSVHTNFVSTSSAAGLQIKGDGTTDGTLQLNCSQNSHGIKIKSPPHSANADYTLTMPNNDGSANEFLQSNGSGVLTWAVPTDTNTVYTHPNHSGEVTSTADGATVIADNIVDEANLKVSNSPTNGYMLTAQSGNTGGMTWAEAGGGRLELIARSANDDSGTSGGIDFNGCFTNTYRNYLLLIGKVAVETNQADLQVRLKDTSNNSLVGNNYARAGQYNDAGNNSTGTNRAIGTSSWIIGPSSNNADSTPTHASFFIYNNTHTTTNDRVFMTGTGLWHHEAQHDPRMFYFGGSYTGGHHCSGLRIETSSGNISDHDFAIFGIKAY